MIISGCCHIFIPSTQEAEVGDLNEFKASLAYKASSGPARATIENEAVSETGLKSVNTFLSFPALWVFSTVSSALRCLSDFCSFSQVVASGSTGPPWFAAFGLLSPRRLSGAYALPPLYRCRLCVYLRVNDLNVSGLRIWTQWLTDTCGCFWRGSHTANLVIVTSRLQGTDLWPSPFPTGSPFLSF